LQENLEIVEDRGAHHTVLQSQFFNPDDGFVRVEIFPGVHVKQRIHKSYALDGSSNVHELGKNLFCDDNLVEHNVKL